MKRTSVTCAMDYFGIGLATPEEAVGYACEVFGLAMVVHHTLRYEGGPHPRLWTVTEPVTGLAVFTASTRAEAIEGAEAKVFEKGGPQAVKREILKHRARVEEGSVNG